MISFQRVVGRRISQTIRSCEVCRGQQQIRSLLRPVRWSSVRANIPKTITKKSLYPERLLVYHAGTGRTAFLGCLKVTTIFIFSFFTLVVAPAHFYAEAEPIWIAGGVFLSGIIPMIFVAYITGPFVTYIHIRVPAFARNSRDMLIRYSKALPKDAELDITTMNFIGKPRVTRLKVADLHPVKERFGMANYCRDVRSINLKRPRWMGSAVSQFGVHSSTSKIMGGEIWGNIAKRIEKS